MVHEEGECFKIFSGSAPASTWETRIIFVKKQAGENRQNTLETIAAVALKSGNFPVTSLEYTFMQISYFSTVIAFIHLCKLTTDVTFVTLFFVVTSWWWLNWKSFLPSGRWQEAQKLRDVQLFLSPLLPGPPLQPSASASASASALDRFPAWLLVEVRRETNVFKSG